MTRRWNLALAATVGLVALGLAGAHLTPSASGQSSAEAPAATSVPDGAEIAIFAGGCFWCVEKDFDHVDGVLQTTSGYIGGRHPNPTYRTHGANGDLEAVEIVYDPNAISYDALAHTFFRTVDPLDDGGQFCDRGNSYRTAIFVLSDDQRRLAETAAAEASEALGRQVVTRIIDAPTFWPAEDYHQDYYQKNPLRYQFYRASCGRDRTVQRVWGEDAYAGVDR